MMGEGTVNDEELVEVIARGYVGDIWPALSERERRFHRKAGEKALAALRSAGFQVYKPEQDVWWCDDCGLAAVYRSDLACPHRDALPVYHLVPADSGGSG